MLTFYDHSDPSEPSDTSGQKQIRGKTSRVSDKATDSIAAGREIDCSPELPMDNKKFCILTLYDQNSLPLAPLAAQKEIIHEKQGPHDYSQHILSAYGRTKMKEETLGTALSERSNFTQFVLGHDLWPLNYMICRQTGSSSFRVTGPKISYNILSTSFTESNKYPRINWQ